MVYLLLGFAAFAALIAYSPKDAHKVLLTVMWAALALSIPVSIIYELAR